MSVRFNGSDAQRISFGSNSVFTPDQLSISMYITFNNVTTLASIVQNYYSASIPPAPSGRGWGLLVQSGNLIFQALCTSSPYAGSWTAPITTGLRHVVITMNFSNIANNPIMYVNGSSVTVTKTGTPAGTFPSGATNTAFYLGDIGAGGYVAMNGDVHSLSLHNIILSADEVLHAYESRLYAPIWNGLVFAPNLNGAAGNVHDGDVLGAGNTMVDMVGGVIGTPGSSPTFANNTVLSIGGE